MTELVVPISITEARTKLNSIVADVAAGGEPVVIANHGRPQAVVISWQQYRTDARQPNRHRDESR